MSRSMWFLVFLGVFLNLQAHLYTLNTLRSLIIPIFDIELLEFFLPVAILSAGTVSIP
ncbi:hypothetical protein Hanom_Chr11g00995561 [Helianthus anomalus]